MKFSRSIQRITSQLKIDNILFQELDEQQQSYVLNQFKKLYSQQMSKAYAEIKKRKKVSSHKEEIQSKQVNQIKHIQQNIQTKLLQHNKKRQNQFKKKVNHFKLLDQNWQRKVQEIHHKQKLKRKEEMEKVLKYRKQAESFWENKSRNKDRQKEDIVTDLPIVASENYFSIKNPMTSKNDSYGLKRKSYSKNQVPQHNKLLPTLTVYKKSQLLRKNKKAQSKTLSNSNEVEVFQQHLQRSKNMNQQKEQFILKKAMQKLQKIQKNRERCHKKLQQNLKQLKLKRQLRQDPVLLAQRRKKLQQDQQQKRSRSKKRRDQRNLHTNDQQKSRINQKVTRHKSHESISLQQSIVQHKHAKEKQQQMQFLERGQLLEQNLKKQRKGKMLRLVKQTISKIKHQTLSKSPI